MAKDAGKEDVAGERFYRTASGDKVPSVTTVIGASLGWNKYVLMAWAHKLGLEGKDFRKEQKQAMSIGTIAHKMAECWLKDEPLPVPETEEDKPLYESATLAFNQFVEWRKLTRLDITESESRVVCNDTDEDIAYGGTIDAIAKDPDGYLHVMDFKTSNNAYAEYIIQIAAYMKAYCFQNNVSFEKFKGVHILRFGKDAPTFAHHYVDAAHTGPAMEAFRALYKLYRLKKVVEKMV